MGGGMAGLLRRRMMQKREQEEHNQETQNRGEESPFDRAFKACMEGRGYTVE
jgi:hypothetical protein